MTFGEKLDRLREDRGVSAREVARRLGLKSSTTIANWIAGDGEPRLSQAVALAAYFGVPLSYLAYENAPPPVAQMQADDQAVLGMYRMLKRTRGMGMEEAMARLDGGGASADNPDAGSVAHEETPPGRERREV